MCSQTGCFTGCLHSPLVAKQIRLRPDSCDVTFILMQQSKLIQRTGPTYPFTVDSVPRLQADEDPGRSALIHLQKAKYKQGEAWLLRWPDSSVRQPNPPSILSLSLFRSSGAAFVDSDRVVYLIDRLTFPSRGRPFRRGRWRFSMDDTRTIARFAIADRYDMAVAEGTDEHRQLAELHAYLQPGGSYGRKLLEMYQETETSHLRRPDMGWDNAQWQLAKRMIVEGRIPVREIRDFISSLC